MKHIKRSMFIILILALVAVPLILKVEPAAADPVYTCLPTCEETDGRFLNIAGVGFNTLADADIDFIFGAPPDAESIEISIFDGDNGGLWDYGVAEVEFTLWADPMKTGAEDLMVGQALGSEMVDNDWYTFDIPITADALAPSGNYFYHMKARTLTPGTTYLSSFKVRSDGVVSFAPQAFAFTAVLLTAAEAEIIYPEYPALTPTTYDGSFDFHFYVPNSVAHIATWDGDLDFGSYDLVDLDTDDPDTPNEPFLPGWAIEYTTAFEGVAVGTAGSTGSPQDDLANPLFRREPSIFYEVSPLNLTPFLNNNPTGNQEWEQFRIDTNPDNLADYYVDDRLPAGLYHIHIEGMDLSNLNAWRTPYNTIGVCEYDPSTGEANPCKNEFQPLLIGDTVFLDMDNDGVQDPDEPGIPGVTVYLMDSYGFPVLDIFNNPISTVTDGNGNYYFDVQGLTIDEFTGDVVVDGIYTVWVGDENFAPGAPLDGLASTTGGETQTYPVIDANVLDYDFGYWRPTTPCGRTGNVTGDNGLVVKKTVFCEADSQWDWDIFKSADYSDLSLAIGQTGKVNYEVLVNASGTHSNPKVSGTIAIRNSTDHNIVIASVSDSLADVQCPVTFPYVLRAGYVLECTYRADLDEAVDENVVIVVDGDGLVVEAVAPINWGLASGTQTDECVDISDSYPGGPQTTVCASKQTSFTFKYPRLFKYTACGMYNEENIAAFVTNDTGATGSSSWTVNVNVACDQICTLTPGYWKTHFSDGPEAFDSIWVSKVGGDTMFFGTGSTYYQILWMSPGGGNAYILLAHQYIAAELNMLNGTPIPDTVLEAWNQAGELLVKYEGSMSIPLQSADRALAIEQAIILNAYNKGRIGPGHCSK